MTFRKEISNDPGNLGTEQMLDHLSGTPINAKPEGERHIDIGPFEFYVEIRFCSKSKC